MSIRDIERKSHVVVIPQGKKSEVWKALAKAMRKLCKIENIIGDWHLEKKVEMKDNLSVNHNHKFGANGKISTIVDKRRNILGQRCLVGWVRNVDSMGTSLSELRRWGIKLWGIRRSLDLWNLGDNLILSELGMAFEAGRMLHYGTSKTWKI